ncbi:HNH endonuclease family protein [Streptomyces lavendulae]|uniref:HNH endonuclease family protein n=1 Tax=Streptomyces lavendulae TaxID=1914 RepID=UPI0033DEAA9F
MRAPLPLFEAIDRLPVAVEHREGYKRDLYKHWNKGLNAGDGCDTRKEVILAEAVGAPQVTAGCKLTGGSWHSAYDNVVVTDAARLDVDHFVPLAEVYDSEQTPWSAARREAYANDQASPDTLIAVSAASNRSKSDKDPAEWLPSDGPYHCTYAATCVGTKLRWDLAVDENERQALLGLAEDCQTTTVVYEPAP